MSAKGRGNPKPEIRTFPIFGFLSNFGFKNRLLPLCIYRDAG
jgi:hypothetical protein